jgi:hypothetical protein
MGWALLCLSLKVLPFYAKARLRANVGATTRAVPTYPLHAYSVVVCQFDELEAAGVLPTTSGPNPFDDELEGAQPEQWWEEHPAERDKLVRTLEQRDQAPRHLYVGARLGHLFGADGLLESSEKKP